MQSMAAPDYRSQEDRQPRGLRGSTAALAGRSGIPSHRRLGAHLRGAVEAGGSCRGIFPTRDCDDVPEEAIEEGEALIEESELLGSDCLAPGRFANLQEPAGTAPTIHRKNPGASAPATPSTPTSYPRLAHLGPREGLAKIVEALTPSPSKSPTGPP